MSAFGFAVFIISCDMANKQVQLKENRKPRRCGNPPRTMEIAAAGVSTAFVMVLT